MTNSSNNSNSNVSEIAELNLAIELERKKISAIVDNMQQALFSVGYDGIILEPVTKFSEHVFGCNIVGENIMQTLYKNLEKQKETYDAVKAALSTAVGESELQWDLVESIFPRKVDYFIPANEKNSQKQKLFKVNISPIWDANSNLERLLFVIDDITDLEKLETQFKQEQEQTGMIECVLENSLDDLATSIKRFHQTLKANRIIAQNVDPVGLMELLRNLHTMKGNARQLKMRVLSDQIHQSEALLLERMSEMIHLDNSVPVIDELNKIENVLDAHSMLIQKFRRSDVGWDENVLPVSPLALIQTQNILKQLSTQLKPDIYDRLTLSLARLEYKSAASLMSKFNDMVDDLAEHLGKKAHLEIYNEALITTDQAIYLQEILLHLIRNSMDHGLESPGIRIQRGKAEVGTIKIEFDDRMDSFSILFSDDGIGVDTERVVLKAVEKGLISAENAAGLSEDQKNNLIFLPNFSTKEDATEISGRGFGMDVVHENIKKLGGNYSLKSIRGLGVAIEITISHSISKKNLKVA